jgi:hypothetical protein
VDEGAGEDEERFESLERRSCFLVRGRADRLGQLRVCRKLPNNLGVAVIKFLPGVGLSAEHGIESFIGSYLSSGSLSTSPAAERSKAEPFTPQRHVAATPAWLLSSVTSMTERNWQM